MYLITEVALKKKKKSKSSHEAAPLTKVLVLKGIVKNSKKNSKKSSKKNGELNVKPKLFDLYNNDENEEEQATDNGGSVGGKDTEKYGPPVPIRFVFLPIPIPV